MPKVLTTNSGKVKIGAYRFSDRVRVALCIEKEGKLMVYGYFTTPEAADSFMDELALLVGAERSE